jgi:hypothetical protein
VVVAGGDPGEDNVKAFRLRQLFVAAVAERRGCAVFALAPPECFLFGNFDFHRLQSGSLVSPVAEGLVGGTATGAPPMGASLYFEREGAFVADDWCFGHN